MEVHGGPWSPRGSTWIRWGTVKTSYPGVTSTHIVTLFVAKSTWHENHRRAFSQIGPHPLLRQWLEGDKDPDLATALWGIKKKIGFKALMKWLGIKKRDGDKNNLDDSEEEESEEEEKKKKKGKGKSKEKSHKRR
ncbi:hypothetical protein BD779DRAFT_1680775 [Infundibulicybe gibba]|nr:hypothetical protein BD779DRAFT_1680775 [Infundibulicybe gibba]